MSYRKAEELALEREQQRLADLQLEEEALHQENIEQSLKRSQRVLQVGKIGHIVSLISHCFITLFLCMTRVLFRGA